MFSLRITRQEDVNRLKRSKSKRQFKAISLQLNGAYRFLEQDLPLIFHRQLHRLEVVYSKSTKSRNYNARALKGILKSKTLQTLELRTIESLNKHDLLAENLYKLPFRRVSTSLSALYLNGLCFQEKGTAYFCKSLQLFKSLFRVSISNTLFHGHRGPLVAGLLEFFVDVLKDISLTAQELKYLTNVEAHSLNPSLLVEVPEVLPRVQCLKLYGPLIDKIPKLQLRVKLSRRAKLDDAELFALKHLHCTRNVRLPTNS